LVYGTFRRKKISGYLKGFGSLFVCHKRDNIVKCGQYLAGLFHECKSNIERMTERVPSSDYEQMQHFISESPWDGLAVMHKVAEKVDQTISPSNPGSGAAQEKGMLLDESGWEKSGKKSVGVCRQYIGQVGKVANGQVGVFAALCCGPHVGLVQGRLYLPQDWADDSKRCDKAGIPKSEQVYRTKPELAVEILRTVPGAVAYDWVGGDCVYGSSPVLRGHLHDTAQPFVMDVGAALSVYLTEPSLYVPEKTSKRGRQRTRYACEDTTLYIKDMTAQIPDGQWQTITHRQGAKGPLVRKAALVDVWIWKPEHGNSVEQAQLLISTETDGSEIKYSLCWQPEGKMTLKTALARQMQRYWVERAFQNVKEQLGLHQYQVRSWTAWYHHVALSLMALHFALQTQIENQQEMPLISVPDIKLIFAKTLLNKLDSHEGILNAINVRHQQRQADIQRFLK
jgi:SRSO17 transposase